MTRRKLVISTLIAVALCLAVGAAIFHNDIAIEYHRRTMLRAWDKIAEIGPADTDQGKWIASFEYHRERLVDYGYLVRVEFPMLTQPPETSRVWKQLMADFPNHIHGKMETTQWGNEKNKITIWDCPDRIPAWKAAILKYDVPEKPAEPESLPEAKADDILIRPML